MNDRLEIASRVLAGMMCDGEPFYEDDGRSCASIDDNIIRGAALSLAYADELIKQEALTRVKKEAEEHK